MNHRPPASASLVQRAVAVARLGRPLHLVGGFVFHGLGLAIALSFGGVVDWTAALWCQVAITTTQLMTHYSNDYFDQDADAAAVTPTRWAGGSRVLPDGLVAPRVALAAALAFGGIAAVAGARLAALSSAPVQMLALLLPAMVLAWSYSSPPLWLNRRGLGEITGALLVPGLTTLLGFQVQAGRLELMPALAVVPLCCFQFAMLLSVNFPDAMGDERVGKRTLVVRLGVGRSAQVFLVVLALGYALLPVLALLGLPRQPALAVALTLPLAGWQAWCIRSGAAADPARWEALGFWSIGLLMSAAVLQAAAFLTLRAS